MRHFLNRAIERQRPSISVCLRDDHLNIEVLFGELDWTADRELESYFERLRERLVRHEVAEELVVYPAYRQTAAGDQTALHESDHLVDQQRDATHLLALLEKSDPSGPLFRSELHHMRRTILAHARAEEEVVLPRLELLPTRDQRSLGHRYQLALEAAPTRPHPHAPRRLPAALIVNPVVAVLDHLRDAIRGAA